jgi:hypothetical protein
LPAIPTSRTLIQAAPYGRGFDYLQVRSLAR